MSKVKIPRRNISLDMTAMCDMAFLLLTFFILSAKFKPQEPIVVDVPSATERKGVKEIPKDSLMIISVDESGKIFFGLGSAKDRLDLINYVDRGLKLKLTEEEKEKFASIETFGIPLSQLKSFLSRPGDKMMDDHPGIPADSINNDLKQWIFYAKQLNGGFMKIAIRGDRKTVFKDADKIIATLQDLRLSKISFVTNLEMGPKKL